ncbi:Uncharacterised protein [Staphylococcus aureus]|nr:Uncharacterised protein [Staphylococcus aureus]
MIKPSNTAASAFPVINLDHGVSISFLNLDCNLFTLMRLWKMLINAGNKVKALSTAKTTLIAEANPITAKKSIPTNDKPHTAITTVTPAKMTALPAVPTASPIPLT